MRGLDPRIHHSSKGSCVAMDCRGKPGNDTEREYNRFPGSQYALSAGLGGLSGARDLATVGASDYKKIT